MARTPKLLVSVRSTDEVHAVIRGGADIVDVKEPNNGPLGNASALTVERISAVMTEKACEQPLSVALGELVDWINPSMEKQELRAVLKRVRPAFLKMGLAGVCQPGRDWKTLLDAAEINSQRRHFGSPLPMPTTIELSALRLGRGSIRD